jgi:phosphate transport system permease protein
MSPSAESVAASAGAYAEPASHLRFRHLKDRLARHTVGLGGIAVLASLMLIFVYLVVEVAPLFAPARAEPRAAYAVPGGPGATLFLAAEEQSEVGLRVADTGEATFFDVATGTVRSQRRLPVGDRSLVSVTPLSLEKDGLAAGLSDGSVLLFRHVYRTQYMPEGRLIEPAIEFPWGETPLPFMDEAPRSLVVREENDVLLFAATDSARRVRLRTAEVQTSLLGDSTLGAFTDLTFAATVGADQVLVNPLMDWLYVVDRNRGRIALHRLRDGQAPELVGAEDTGGRVVQARFLSGGISVLTASEDGRIRQWFPARRAEADAEGEAVWYLARVREFTAQAAGAATALGVEQRRRRRPRGHLPRHFRARVAGAGFRR